MTTQNTGFDHEISFWKEFVKSARFKHNWLTAIPNPECRPETWELIKSEISANPKAKILDIGSGVMSILRGITYRSRIIACDPLADEYAKIFDYNEYGYEPVQKAYAEQLPYTDNSFDIVHISNALDHTQDPEKAISEMERVCKIGGLIVICGFTNEGEHQKYQGLHQWNIDLAAISGGEAVLMIFGLGLAHHIFKRFDYKQIITAVKTTLPETQREWFLFAYRNG